MCSVFVSTITNITLFKKDKFKKKRFSNNFVIITFLLFLWQKNRAYLDTAVAITCTFNGIYFFNLLIEFDSELFEVINCEIDTDSPCPFQSLK